jgi:phosphatidylserine/phosphatidylglycerophosphate/cardiolipin synthase-like enzyme
MLEVRTLRDGSQAPGEMAEEVADFLRSATRSLDLAQYDFHLEDEAAEIVGGALREAHDRGVAVRIAYDVGHPNPIPVPPPPEPDVTLIASLGVPHKPIAGEPDLMHHKYVVRDGEAVWTGSMNWTNDSFTRQENVVLRVGSQQVARAFTADFEQIWETGDVSRSGFVEPRTTSVDGTPVRAWFTPGHGEDLSARIARALGRATRRIRIASPVITTGAVLAALAQVAAQGRVDLAGVVDQTQMRGVVGEWSKSGNIHWKLPLLQRGLAGGFSGKRSAEWRPEGGLHDFMHAKVTVADDLVFVGSYNLSRSGEKNAENVVELESAELAETLAAYIDEIRALYPPAELETMQERPEPR